MSLGKQPSPAELAYSGTSVNPRLEERADFVIRLGTADGFKVPLENVLTVELDEDMRSVVPSATITFSDEGDLMRNSGLRVGMKIFVKLYVGGSSDEKREPAVNMEATIRQLSVEFKNDGTKYYEVFCVVGSENLFSVVRYDSPVPEGSIYALKSAYGTLGFGIDNGEEIRTNDTQIWINGTLKTADFIRKVLSRSYLSSGSSLVAIPRLDKTVLFTATSTLMNSSPSFTFYPQNFKNSLENGAVDYDAAATAFFDSASRTDNSGISTDLNGLGGYLSTFDFSNTRDKTVYNPDDHVSLLDILTLDTAKQKRGFTSMISKTGLGSFPSNLVYEFDKVECEECGWVLSDVSIIKDNKWTCRNCNHLNSFKDSSELGLNRKIPGSIGSVSSTLMSLDTHQYYEAAPLINKYNRLSLFQNNFVISFTPNLQGRSFIENPNSTIKAGNVVAVRFELDTNDSDKVNDGTMIVTRVQHLYAKQGVYTISLTLSNSGSNSLGGFVE